MAIFTSKDGNFQVEAISFSPNVITLGEETSFSISIKNVSGRNIKKLIMRMIMVFKDENGIPRQSNESFVFGQYPLESSLGYWNNGKTVTFTGKYKFESYYKPSNSSRVLPIYKANEMGYAPSNYDGDIGLELTFLTDVFFNSMQNNDQIFNLRGANSEYLTVIDARYNPSIPVFVGERSTGEILNDEGENVLSTFKLDLSDAAFPDRTGLILKYRNKSEGDSDYSQINMDSLIEDSLTKEITAVIREKIDSDSDWEFVLWFGDEYESASAKIEVPKAFANVHLAGVSTGGVCFGGFSKSTEGNPLFQCYYPAILYEGIEGVTCYSNDEVAIGRWIDGKRVYRKVFTGNIAAGGITTFDAIPNMETLVGINGMMKWTASGTWVPLVYSAGNTTYNTASADAEGRVSVTCTGAATCFVIVDYTKTVEEVSE